MNNISVLLFVTLIIILALNTTWGSKRGYVLLADIVRGFK